MGYWGEYPEYISVAERRAKAERKLKQLRKKNPDIQPVILEGKKLASTWWGKAWNTNLERYADYSNRIGRGRSYVRHGAVLDLQILSGEVRALVQGSRANPYSVTIKIKKIDENIWKEIRTACEGKLDSLSELLMGKFPKELAEIFTAKGKGLFPSPREIEFDCSCPDWASMCKHVAATLYGVGARLDQDPGLFFKLRKVDINDLITQAVEKKTQKLLKKAEEKSSRVIEDTDIAGIFGIEIDEPVKAKVSAMKKSSKVLKKQEKIEAASTKPEAKKIKTKKETPNSVAKKRATRRNSVKNAVEKKNQKLSIIDRVVKIIKKSKQGITVADIAMKTKLDERQIHNALYRARERGIIKSEKRGVYIG